MAFPPIGYTSPTVSLPAEPADTANGVPLPLAAKVATYKTLSDAGTWGEQRTARASTAKVRLSWDTVDDWRITKALLGYSYVANQAGQNELFRVTPLRRPKSRALAYLRELNLVQVGMRNGIPANMTTQAQAGVTGAGGKNPQAYIGGVYMDTDGWPTGEKMVYEAKFGPLDFPSVGTGDAYSWTVGGFSEMNRYTKGVRNPRPKELRIPASGFPVIYDTADTVVSTFFGGTPTVSAALGTPIVQTEIEYTYTWFQIPVVGGIPEAALSYNLNRVNSVPFDGYVFKQFPAYTMLFKGWRESDPYPGSDGAYYVDLTYVFGFRGGVDNAGNVINWHKVALPNGTYGTIRRQSITDLETGQPMRIYQQADHMKLWQVP